MNLLFSSSNPTYKPLRSDPIRLEIVGSPVDLHSVSVAFIFLQDVADKVARELLLAANIMAPANFVASIGRLGPSKKSLVPVVRLELREARVGSFETVLIRFKTDPAGQVELDITRYGRNYPY